MKKTTILFDLDGTLLNTLTDIYVCINHVLKANRYKERTIDEVRTFVGNGMNKALERAIFPNKITQEEFLNMATTFKNYYDQNMYEYTKPYNGIINMLKELKENGYKLGVISNKYDNSVKKLCDKYFNGYIDVAIGESEGIRKKPETDGVFKACKELNVNIEECIFVGDSDVDILTAEKANIPCISVLWGFKDKEYLIEKGAKNISETPNEIIKLIKTIEKKSYLV